eukprot:7193562-Pyramimonas_sp.AAC.2
MPRVGPAPGGEAPPGARRDERVVRACVGVHAASLHGRQELERLLALAELGVRVNGGRVHHRVRLLARLLML